MSIEHMTRIDEGGNVRLLQPKIVTQQVVAERMAARAGVETERAGLIDRVADSINNFFDGQAPAELAPAVIEAKPEKIKDRRQSPWKKVTALAMGAVSVFSAVGGANAIATAQSGNEANPLAPEISPAVSCVDDVLAGTDLADDIEVNGQTYSVVTPKMRFNNSIGNNPNQRVNTDSISTPLQGETVDDMYSDFERKICTEPLLLAETASVLARVKVDGARLSESNPWLDRFIVDPNQIDEIAEDYVPFAGANQALSDTEQMDAVEANQLMQRDAGKVIALLRQMLRFGVVDATAGYNLGLAELLATNGIPDLELKSSYDGEFITYVITSKTDGCVVVLGANTSDGRLTVLGCHDELPQLPEVPVSEVPETPVVETPDETTTSTTTGQNTTTTTTRPTTTTTAPTTTTTQPTTTTTAPTTTTTQPTTTTTAPTTTTTTPPPTHPTVPGPPGGVIIENQNSSNNGGN